jgi:hypothetical protein
MRLLSRDELMPLEEYAEKRSAFRAQVMAHKKNRQVHIGAHATLYFEDRMTIQYQIQEMLRVERIFERAGIEEELQAYNPLIPDGLNLKATFMLEYADPEVRAQALEQLIGIEDLVWIAVDSHPAIYAIADEDLERANADKTSAVHFLRFELQPGQVQALKNGATLAMGIDHDHYSHRIDALSAAQHDALVADFD